MHRITIEFKTASQSERRGFVACLFTTFFCGAVLLSNASAHGDSVNSPNITLNVDTNRAIGSGNGAGGVFININTITIAEITLPEYNVGDANRLLIGVQPGFQFDPASPITMQCATFGINGGSINAVATLVPTGQADEVLTFNLTSAIEGFDNTQDIFRVNGVRVRILNAVGAEGPAKTTMKLTTSTAGGAFTNQGIVAANITRGAADRLVFATQPGNSQAGQSLLPAVSIVDFGGNTITNDTRSITLTLAENPGAATLLGITQQAAIAGVAAWAAEDGMNLTTAAAGYTLRATHGGAALLTSDSAESASFEVTSGPPGSIEFSAQPVDTQAGSPILISVTARDGFGNLSAEAVNVTLDAAVNPAGWPLLVDTTLTKATVAGVATWDATDNLRINSAVDGYRLAGSGLGATIFSDPFAIVPGDAALLAFVQQPSNTVADSVMSPGPSIGVTDEFGNRTASNAGVQLTLIGASDSGAITGGVVAAVNGLATFDALSIGTVATGVTLAAAAPGLIGTTSDAFNLLEGPPVATRMEFSQQPVDTGANEPLLVSVTVFDQFGRPFTAAAAQITLSLETGPVGSELLADLTLSKPTVNGVATWNAADRLRIALAGAGYTLGAAGVGPDVTSDAFAVLAGDVGIVGDDENNDGDAAAAPCGACGAGATFAIFPLLLGGALIRRPLRRISCGHW